MDGKSVSIDLKTAYDKIARDWSKAHGRQQWWRKSAEAFAKFLKPQCHILDVGCGSGLKTRFFISKGFLVTGLDLSPEMIIRARKAVPKATFNVGDLRDLAKQRTTFDGIYAQAVLLHIPKKEIPGVLKTFSKILEKGGYLLIGVKEIWPDQAQEEMVHSSEYGYPTERFYSYFTLDEMKKLLHSAGFKLCYEQIVTRRDKTHWLELIAQKG